MPTHYKIVVTTGKDREVFDLAAGAAGRIRPVRIKAVDGARYELSDGDTPPAQAPSTAGAVKVRRAGRDLQLLLDGSRTPDAVLEGYYDVAGDGRALLVGRLPDGSLHEYVALDSGSGVPTGVLAESAEPMDLVLADEALGSGAAVGALLPAVAAGPGALAAALGGVAAAAAGGGGGGGGSGTGGVALTPTQALDAIRAAADGNTASTTSLPVSTYTSAGVNGVNADNLAAINDVLNSQGVDASTLGSTAADTVAKLQAIVDAYTKVLNAADNLDGNITTILAASDYVALHLSGVSEASAALLSDVVDGKLKTEVDTVAELQALADAAQAVLYYKVAGIGGPTSAQIGSLVPSSIKVSDDAQTVLQFAILAANNGSDPINTQSRLEAVVSATMTSFYASKDKLIIFADTETTGLSNAIHPVPTLADYSHVAVSGVTSSNLDAINDALASALVTGATVYTLDKLQMVVDAYVAILAEANDTNANAGDNVTDATSDDPSAAQYQAIGVVLGDAATDAESLALLNDIVGASQTVDVDTVAEIQNLVRIANAIELTAAGGSPSTALTVADLSKMGLNTTGLTDGGNLPAWLALVASKANDGSQTDSLLELQALIDAFDKVAPATPSAAPASYKDDAGTITNPTAAPGTSTDDSTPGIFVGAGLSDTPNLYVDGVKVAASYDSTTGWLTPTNPVSGSGANGTTHQFAYTLSDANGNESGASPALAITVDTTAPTTLAPSRYRDNSGTGVWGTAGSTTHDTTPGLEVETYGYTPTLYVDGVKVAAVYSADHLLTPLSPLAIGAHTLSYTLTDAVGNVSARSAELSLTIPVVPVVLDLDGDGQISYGHTVMDVNGDGVLDRTAWAAPQDGVLVRDANHDGRVSGMAEFAFGGDGKTDLQGLAALYDSNGDGVLDAQDALFGEFAVWQDANGNGVSEAGELLSLQALGMVSLDLHSDGVQRTPAAGVSEAGRTHATRADGSQLLVADAAFELAPAQLHWADVLAQSATAQGGAEPVHAPVGLGHDALLAHALDAWAVQVAMAQHAS